MLSRSSIKIKFRWNKIGQEGKERGREKEGGKKEKRKKYWLNYIKRNKSNLCTEGGNWILSTFQYTSLEKLSH